MVHIRGINKHSCRMEDGSTKMSLLCFRMRIFHAHVGLPEGCGEYRRWRVTGDCSEVAKLSWESKGPTLQYHPPTKHGVTFQGVISKGEWRWGLGPFNSHE